MPFYIKQGKLPEKPHTVFKKPNGELHAEELMGRSGFSHHSSLLYHLEMPTRVKKVGPFRSAEIRAVRDANRNRHIQSFKLKSDGELLESRIMLLYNADLRISICRPDRPTQDFYRNGHFDEVYYIQEGDGALETQFGFIPIRANDYVVIPRGTIWKMRFHGDRARLLLIESSSMITTPKRYRSPHGQLLEHAPFCERDIRVPELQKPSTKKGDYTIRTVLADGVQELTYDSHPFDLVGWDGYHYPWAFNVNDFAPIVGKLHQPPPVHQVFEANGFVICNFVDRLFDFHPDAIPAPYPHSNVDSDEVLFYSVGNFMSRKGISVESITLHPMGLAHGPHPGCYEGSVGKKETKELAIMIDTFKPLKVAEASISVDDPKYPTSWL